MKIFHFHCWHEITNTRRNITRIDRCRRIGETIVQNGGFVLYKVDRECCICSKRGTIIWEDHDVHRASKYLITEQEYETLKNGINI